MCQYEGKFENTTMQPCSDGQSILQNAKFVVDLSVITHDGGGTQYTFLEAIHEDCVLVLHKDWVRQGNTFQHGEIFSTGLFYRGRTLLVVTIAVHTDVTCRKVALPCQ
jgi:hypothetical protein